MTRDIVIIPLNEEESLIIATDNSGGIGMKMGDLVKVPYEMVAYYSLRVAAMECIAGGGEPISVVLHNFCGNEPWGELVKGVQKGLNELGLKQVPVTGSTESNFPLNQSAVGLIVIGKKVNGLTAQILYSDTIRIAVIGLPLVGIEVVEQQYDVAPLSIFQEISSMKEIVVLPVGSKGILYEMNQLFSNIVLGKENLITELDVLKSSGPSTCFIVVYPGTHEEKIRNLAGDHFHFIEIK